MKLTPVGDKCNKCDLKIIHNLYYLHVKYTWIDVVVVVVETIGHKCFRFDKDSASDEVTFR